MIKALPLALVVSLWLTAPVWAVEPGAKAEKKQGGEAIKLNLQTQAGERNLEQCRLKESKVNFRLNQDEQTRGKYYQVYQGVRKRIADLITKNEGRGCDMTQAKSDLTQFDTLIQDFAASFRMYQASMSTAKSHACDASKDQFVKSIGRARQDSSEVKQKAQAVHAFFKSTIQPRLSQKLKECNPSPRPSPSTTPVKKAN